MNKVSIELAATKLVLVDEQMAACVVVTSFHESVDGQMMEVLGLPPDSNHWRALSDELCKLRTRREWHDLRAADMRGYALALQECLARFGVEPREVLPQKWCSHE